LRYTGAMRKLLQEGANAIEWPFGFLLFLGGFVIFLASPMQDRWSIGGAILATIGIVVALDAVSREGSL
jgi:hypothetical protein